MREEDHTDRQDGQRKDDEAEMMEVISLSQGKREAAAELVLQSGGWEGRRDQSLITRRSLTAGTHSHREAKIMMIRWR